MFPPGYFYIISRKHGYALDVFNGETKSDVNIIVWPQKFQDSDNQLWTYDNGRLINKKSGHALDVRTSAFKRDKVCIQYKIKDSHEYQQWGFENGFIHSVGYPSMVLDIKGDSEDGGAQVLLYNRKETDNLNQLWFLEPYEQFESSLGIAADAGPLHKKPGFGQPRLGYGAEVGIPPGLDSLPENIKVVGVNGNEATPSFNMPPSKTNPEDAQPAYPPQQPQEQSTENGSQTQPTSYPPGSSGYYSQQPQQSSGYPGYPQPSQPYGTPSQQPYGLPSQPQPYSLPSQQHPYGSPPSQYDYPPPQQPYSAPPSRYNETQYQYGDYNVFSQPDYTPQPGTGPYGTGYPSEGGYSSSQQAAGYPQSGGNYQSGAGYPPPPPGGAGGFYPPPSQRPYQAPYYPQSDNYPPYPSQ
ncbi:ricin B lectin domain-containing protein [Dichotomocladium elegans]|nr:ricin B lectin domain-containing protein [Dichotomocladium elegans]